MSTATIPTVAGTRRQFKSSFQSSQLNKNAPAVFDAAAEGPVELTRAHGETYVLMTEREDDARNELFTLAANIIGAATDTDGTLVDRLAAHMPWMLALSADDRAECAKSLLDAARASFSLRQPTLALRELRSWHATAEAVAAGFRLDNLTFLPEPEAVD